jgi:transcriptional regulator with XRE-family HTH domain
MFRITWRAARVNRGYTLKEVAELSGKSIDTVIKYEKDSFDIPYDLMQLWLKLYNVPADNIHCGRESDLIGKEKAS